jgi:hypothetical protein
VFENRVVRIIFRLKREEIGGDWRRLHNEELHNLYASSFIRMIKSSRMRWVAHTALMGEMHTKFWSKNLKGRDYSEELDSDGKIILEWILGKYDWKVWTEFIWLRIGTSGGFL